MKPVLLVTVDFTEAREIMKTISQEYSVTATKSPNGLVDNVSKSSLVAVDHSFTEHHGKDYLAGILRNVNRPVLILSPPEAVRDAIEAVALGASSYVVKAGDYHQVLNLSIKVALEKFKEQEETKQNIVALKEQVQELEARVGNAGNEDVQGASDGSDVNILDQIVFIFKRGEINLPSPPQISLKFKEMVSRGVNLQEIAYLLKQDAAISSKLISISNSAFYRGVAENNTLEQAVGRLGLTTTKRYVDVITNRTLYFTKNKRLSEVIEKLWEHSLSCAYAAQIICEVLKLNLPEDAFTMGLLHDIGKLVLFQAVGELQMKKKIGEEIDSEELFNTVDTNHGRFGAALLKQWKFSKESVDIVTYHDHLEEANSISKELLVVHIANLLVKSMGYNLAGETDIDVEGAESARLLKLDAAMIAEVKKRVEMHMDEMKGYFG